MSGADHEADGEGDDTDVSQVVPDTQVQHILTAAVQKAGAVLHAGPNITFGITQECVLSALLVQLVSAPSCAVGCGRSMQLVPLARADMSAGCLQEDEKPGPNAQQQKEEQDIADGVAEMQVCDKCMHSWQAEESVTSVA